MISFECAETGSPTVRIALCALLISGGNEYGYVQVQAATRKCWHTLPVGCLNLHITIFIASRDQ